MNEEAVRLALLVARVTRERDEARAALDAHICATEGRITPDKTAAEVLVTPRPPDQNSTTRSESE